MDIRSLGTKVFTCMIIKISSEKWWKQKLGTEYSKMSSAASNIGASALTYYYSVLQFYALLTKLVLSNIDAVSNIL